MPGSSHYGCALAVEVAGNRAPDTPFTFEIVGTDGELLLAGGHPHGFQAGRLTLSLGIHPRQLQEATQEPRNHRICRNRRPWALPDPRSRLARRRRPRTHLHQTIPIRLTQVRPNDPSGEATPGLPPASGNRNDDENSPSASTTDVLAKAIDQLLLTPRELTNLLAVTVADNPAGGGGGTALAIKTPSYGMSDHSGQVKPQSSGRRCC
jgi:hypothetical protein